LLRWLAALSGIVLAGLVVVVLYLALADLGHFRDRLTVLVSDSLGREVRIDGPLSLRLGRVARVHARGISVANPAWADEPFLFAADSLTAEVALWSFVRGPVRIETLELSGAVLQLQEAADGRRNWTNSEPHEQAASAIESLPRVHAFAANGLRIVVSRPAFTRPTELVIDTADFSNRDGLFASRVSAKVNGVPFYMESKAGPDEGASTAGALQLRFDATLGEITLQGKAEGIDLRSLAVASAEVGLVGPDAGYLLGALNLPAITSGPLNLEATLAPDPGHSGFSATGRLGEYRLAAEGWFEDFRGTGGFDVNWRIAGPDLAMLGQRLAIVDLPAAPFETAGTIRSQDGRIDIDDATMTVGELTLRSQASLIERDGGGKEASMQIQVGDLSGRLTAVTRVGLSLDGADLDFVLQGPNAAAVGKAVGVDGLGAVPFVARGRGKYETGMLALDAASLELDEQRLRLSGRVGTRSRGAGTDLRFTAGNLDLSPWIETPAWRHPALKSIGGTGRVRVSDTLLNLDALALKAGDIGLTGSIAFTVGTASAKFALELTGTDAAAVTRPLGIDGLSAEPFVLVGRGTYDVGMLAFDAASLELGEQRLGVTGRLRAGSGNPEADVRLVAEKLDLSPWLAGNDYLAPALQTISGTVRLRRSRESLNLDELSMMAGPASLAGEIAVNVDGRGDSGRFDLRFEAPSAAGLSPALDRVRRVDERIEMSGAGSWSTKGLALRDAAVQLSDRGELRGTLDYVRGERPFVSVALNAERLDLRTSADRGTEIPVARNDGRVGSQDPCDTTALDFSISRSYGVRPCSAP
jgi:uncharacterized protein involved in outer membrane biogenesis